MMACTLPYLVLAMSLFATATLTLNSTTAPPTPTCNVVSPTAVDTPAATDNTTGLLFRSSCGISAFTVTQCPYLCSQGGGGLFKECSNSDLSGDEPTGQFPPIECSHCLPPCPVFPANTTTASVPTATASVAPTRSFKLKSRVLKPHKAHKFDKLYLESYHIEPAFDYAVLHSQTGQDPGIVGHLNGTATEIAHREADLLFPGNGFPYGFVLSQINAFYGPVEINAGIGTKGIYIDGKILKYDGAPSGGFYGMQPSDVISPSRPLG